MAERTYQRRLALHRQGIYVSRVPLAPGEALVYTSASSNGPARIFLALNSLSNAEPQNIEEKLQMVFTGDSSLLLMIPHFPIITPDGSMISDELFEPNSDATLIDISSAFPKSVQQELGKEGRSYGELTHCSNCLGAALATIESSARTYADLPQFAAFLNDQMQLISLEESPLRFGDLLYFPGAEHAAIYLFAGLVYQKPTWGVAHRFEIVRYEDLYRAMNQTINIYKYGEPMGSVTRSSWDIFVSGISGRRPLPQPPALGSEAAKKQVLRYRPKAGMGTSTESQSVSTCPRLLE